MINEVLDLINRYIRCRRVATHQPSTGLHYPKNLNMINHDFHMFKFVVNEVRSMVNELQHDIIINEIHYFITNACELR